MRFDVAIPNVNEITGVGDPYREARDNALLKNAWGRERFPRLFVLSADTVVVLGRRCFGKPRSAGEAREFLRALSDRVHHVVTAAVLSTPAGGIDTVLTRSSVRFRRLSESDIDAYLAAVDPLDKAGAYDIDQRGDLIIASFSGSRTNIMGLSRELVGRWLAQHPELRP